MIVEGGAQLREVALRLKLAGDVELKKAMYRNLRAATEPARKAVVAEERAVLPKRGGLNEWVAETKVGHRTLIGARTAGITLVQSRKGRTRPHDLRKMNEGHLRHPVYADPSKSRRQWTWVEQDIPSGWWDRPLLASRPIVLAACLHAMHETSRAAGFRP